jgi:hypothetical protein
MMKRDLAAWDAEIEAEFRRTVASTKAAERKNCGRRLIGSPMAFAVDVYRSTEGRAAYVVAQLIYRRTRVCNSRTVTLPNAELAAFGIERSVKRKALTQLAAAGLIRVERNTAGRTSTITLLWRSS